MDAHTQTLYRSRRQKHRRINFSGYAAAMVIVSLILIVYTAVIIISGKNETIPPSATAAFIGMDDLDLSQYPNELAELYIRNPETIDFIKSYPDRERLRQSTIDISDDFTPKTVPLFMQWDTRWGYCYYGDDLIAIAGCGPTCLSMAYIGLTGDTSMNPRAMAEYVYRKGYYSSSGTKWNLWTKGVDSLGLEGYEIILSENAMKNQLDRGGVIICSMRPGDFTTVGHFILIRGYDKNGFYVNDPNSRENSMRQWSYRMLEGQIKGMWGLSKQTE